MIIQNIHNPKVINEITRKEWDALGKSQKVFKILDETDSKMIKEQIIVSTVSSAKERKTFSEKLDEKSEEIISKSKKEEKEKK